jgi:endonuclease YncB( thermonuclease family)
MARRLKKRTVKKLVVLSIGGGILIAQHFGWLNTVKQTAQASQPGLYSVNNYVDGDTITVDMNGSAETLRFIGVDTPETHDPRKVVQCFGVAAAAFTKQIITKQGSRVRLEADPLNTNRDRYGRLLRYIYLPDGTLVNAEIIKQGYGFAYTGFPFTKSDEFIGYQKTAREGNLGLWKSCTPVANQYGGFTSNNAN